MAGLLGKPLGLKPPISNKDANTIVDTGIYYVGGGNKNMPNYGFLVALNFGSSSDVVQVFFSYSQNTMQYRVLGKDWKIL